MRCSMFVAASLLVLPGDARAQAYGSPYFGGQGLQSLLAPSYSQPVYGARRADPCQPASGGGSALGMLASALTQAQRDRDCAAERQAQWAEYAAKQKAAKDKADEESARATQQAKDAAQMQAAAQAQRADIASRAAARRAAQAARARQERAETALAARQAEQQARTEQHAREIALVRAENAPDNVCRAPKLARGVMQGWNGLAAFKEVGVEVIDIEHVTTVYFHPDTETFACHGVFVTNRGWKVAGTTTMKRNVAGDPMFLWTRDARQDLSSYEARPQEDAMSPEMASQTQLGGEPVGVTQAVSAGR